MNDDLSDFQTPYLIELSKDQEYWTPLEVLDELQEFNGKLGPIEISCVAECTELDFLFDLQALAKKSKTTHGSGDDDFMQLLIAIEGDYGFAGYYGFKSWFNQTWDYGGSSMIGNDTLLDCIQLYQKYESDYSFFESELSLIHKDFLNALAYEYIFNYPAETVLREYDKILQLNFFEGEDKTKIKEHYNAIQKGGESFQFDCANSDCAYG